MGEDFLGILYSYIQGPHGNLAQKENLSHTLKNKVLSLIFLVFHDDNISKRIKTKKIDEATPCISDVVDSRAVVGLGERNLHLAPGAVIMYANGATTEDFRESEVLWWVLLDDYFADFREKNLLRVSWGADHQQYPNSTFGSLKASIFANPATMAAFRVSKV